MEIVAFVMTNWETIVAVLFALHGLALAVVNLTATPKDDEFVGKAYKVIEIIAGIGRKAKELPAEAAGRSPGAG